MNQMSKEIAHCGREAMSRASKEQRISEEAKDLATKQAQEILSSHARSEIGSAMEAFEEYISEVAERQAKEYEVSNRGEGDELDEELLNELLCATRGTIPELQRFAKQRLEDSAKEAIEATKTAMKLALSEVARPATSPRDESEAATIFGDAAEKAARKAANQACKREHTHRNAVRDAHGSSPAEAAFAAAFSEVADMSGEEKKSHLDRVASMQKAVEQATREEAESQKQAISRKVANKADEVRRDARAPVVNAARQALADRPQLPHARTSAGSALERAKNRLHNLGKESARALPDVDEQITRAVKSAEDRVVTTLGTGDRYGTAIASVVDEQRDRIIRDVQAPSTRLFQKARKVLGTALEEFNQGVVSLRDTSVDQLHLAVNKEGSDAGNRLRAARARAVERLEQVGQETLDALSSVHDRGMDAAALEDFLVREGSTAMDREHTKQRAALDRGIETTRQIIASAAEQSDSQLRCLQDGIRAKARDAIREGNRILGDISDDSGEESEDPSSSEDSGDLEIVGGQSGESSDDSDVEFEDASTSGDDQGGISSEPRKKPPCDNADVDEDYADDDFEEEEQEGAEQVDQEREALRRAKEEAEWEKYQLEIKLKAQEHMQEKIRLEHEREVARLASESAAKDEALQREREKNALLELQRAQSGEEREKLKVQLAEQQQRSTELKKESSLKEKMLQDTERALKSQEQKVKKSAKLLEDSVRHGSFAAQRKALNELRRQETADT
mmetsp:Transcript_4133/g.14442  ORF Transcript_4133/g.14442 Transcript_4133/m.14442 type:complete len:738 (-) Transcript_4133:95-2308(-)